MTDKLNTDFLKKLQRGVEPQIRPGETAIEYLKRTEAEKVASMIQNPAPTPPPPPQQQVIFYKGYKLPRDFFTCMALCIIKLNDPELNEIMESFGFHMQDLDGKPITFKKEVKKRKEKKNGKYNYR